MMTRPVKRRLFSVLLALLGMGGSLWLVFDSLRDNLVFFFSPTEIQSKQIPPTQKIRVGGLVKRGSLQRMNDQTVTFTLTDLTTDMEVAYQGLLPDLFREGQGAVAEGYLTNSHAFHAETILAKHDERYRPPESKEPAGAH